MGDSPKAEYLPETLAHGSDCSGRTGHEVGYGVAHPARQAIIGTRSLYLTLGQRHKIKRRDAMTTVRFRILRMVAIVSQLISG